METILDQVQTSEANIEYAGFWRRFAAAFLDSLLLGFLSSFILGGLMGVSGVFTNPGLFSDPSQLAQLISMMGSYYFITLVLQWLYFAVLECSSNQATLGKMALGLIVVSDKDKGRPGFGQTTGRYFGKILSSMILGIGYLMMLWSPKNQTLHDQISGCIVVKK
jgi:uncharacterized RDD family membrane protein YckC